MSRLLEVARPFFACNAKVNEDFHYFMFSIDIFDDLVSGVRDLEEIHMYIGKTFISFLTRRGRRKRSVQKRSARLI